MQRAKALVFQGVTPNPQKGVIVNRYPLLGRAGGDLTTYPLLYGSQSQGIGGSPPTDYPQWVGSLGQPPSQREREGAFGKYSP